MPAMPQAMPQQAQAAQASPQSSPQASPQSAQQGDGKQAAFTNMVISVDQGLSKISQVIGQADPEAGKELQQINQSYRDIISKVAGGGEDQSQSQGSQGQPAGQQPPQASLRGSRSKRVSSQAPMETAGKSGVAPAY